MSYEMQAFWAREEGRGFDAALLENRAADERRLENPPGDVNTRALGACVESLFVGRACVIDEVVVKTDDMFAKTVLGLSDSEALCPFLQEMDRAETQIQVEEQRQIQEKRIDVKAGLNASFAVAVGLPLFTFLLPALIPVQSLIVGGIVALISDNTDAFGNATRITEKKLDIYGKRVGRLAGMVDKIARERVVSGKEEGELSQLRRVEQVFSTTISKYREWKDGPARFSTC